MNSTTKAMTTTPTSQRIKPASLAKGISAFLRPQDLMVPHVDESTIGIDGEPQSEIPILNGGGQNVTLSSNDIINMENMANSPIAESVETNSDEENQDALASPSDIMMKRKQYHNSRHQLKLKCVQQANFIRTLQQALEEVLNQNEQVLSI